MPTKTATKTKASSTKRKQEEMSLQDLLVTKLKALLYIENELVKALPKMAKNASDEELSAGFEKHLEQTKEHVERVNQAFEMLDEHPSKIECEGIDGIVSDAEWGVEHVEGDAALDANLIAAAQYAEHYEIAGYTSAIAWAKALDKGDVADLLQQTLDEEQETSDTLAELANAKIDERAVTTT